MEQNIIPEEYSKGRSWASAWLDENAKRESELEKAKKLKKQKDNFKKTIITIFIFSFTLYVLYKTFQIFINS